MVGTFSKPRRIHRLKTWPESYRAIVRGDQKSQLRRNDRGFNVGDYLVLQEFVPRNLDTEEGLGPHPAGTYTGQHVTRCITHIGKGFGLPEGHPEEHVVLSIRDLDEGDQAIIASLMPVSFPVPETTTVADQTMCGQWTEEELRRYQTDKPPVVTAAQSDPIPPGVRWSNYIRNFYDRNDNGMGQQFYDRWRDRRYEFPEDLQKQDAAPHLDSPGEMKWRPLDESVLATAMRQTPPRSPITDHQRELLTILMEELFACYHQASKLLRFGKIGTDHSTAPPQSYDNIALLASEMGDVQQMLNVVGAAGIVDQNAVLLAARRKELKLSTYLQTKTTP